MIKKYIGITLITASMLAMGCSSSDDDDGDTTGGTTTDGGTTDGGTTDGGTTDGGTTDGGTTDGGTTDGGTTDGGTTDGGTTDGGTTDGGTTDGGTTDGGTTDGGTTDGGTTDGGTTDGGTTDGGTTDGGGANTIVEALGAAGFSSLVNSLARAGLTDTVAGANGTDGWTLFAPSDTAIAGADFPSMSEEDLADLLRYHLVAGPVTLADGPLNATSNQELAITTDADAGAGFAVNGNPMAAAIAADNGTIYGIEAVLTAP